MPLKGCLLFQVAGKIPVDLVHDLVQQHEERVLWTGDELLHKGSAEPDAVGVAAFLDAGRRGLFIDGHGRDAGEVGQNPGSGRIVQVPGGVERGSEKLVGWGHDGLRNRHRAW